MSTTRLHPMYVTTDTTALMARRGALCILYHCLMMRRGSGEF